MNSTILSALGAAKGPALWTLDRFLTGFIWGFAFMLGLWVFGTLVGL